MAGKLGATFHDAAIAPLEKANRLVMSDHFDDAMTCIAREELMRFLRRGVEQVATAANVSPLAVFGRLNMDELDRRLGCLAACQAEALSQWRGYAGHAGGLLGASLFPDDGQLRDLPANLRRAAATLQSEKELSACLSALADEMAGWITALAQRRDLIGNAQDLARGRRMRRLKRAVAALLLLTIPTAAGLWLTKRSLARARVDAIIAMGSCDGGEVAEGDLELASSEQRAAIEGERKRCEDEGEQARLAEQARQRAEEKRKATEREEKRRLEACARLGHNFAAGALDEVDAKLVGEQGALLRRLRSGGLTADDVAAGFEPPCADTGTGKQLRLAYARAVLSTMQQWLRRHTPSRAARDALAEHKSALPADELVLLAGHIDVLAKRAVMTGKAADVRHHAALCELAEKLADTRGGNCEAVLTLAEQL